MGQAVMQPQGQNEGSLPLTWIQVCHAVITQGSTLITGQRLPEGFSQAWWLVPIHLAFHPPPLVQQAGRNIFHTLLLTVLIWDTSQLTPVPSSAPVLWAQG